MQIWPLNLPALPIHEDYSGSRQSGVIRDDSYNGKVNSRRRFTATSKYHNVTMVVSKTEYLVFLNFFENSIGHGTLTFEYTNPIFQNGDIVCRIKNDDPPYSIAYQGSTLDYVIQFVLEELPGTIKNFYAYENKVTTLGEDKSTTLDEYKITDK